MEIGYRNISREEEIQRLTLINKFLTVSSKINKPALVDFLSGFEYISNYLREPSCAVMLVQTSSVFNPYSSRTGISILFLII